MLPLRIHLIQNNYPEVAHYEDGKLVLPNDKTLTMKFPFHRKFNTTWVLSSLAKHRSPPNYTEILFMIDSNQADYSNNIHCGRMPWLLDIYKNVTVAPLTVVRECYTLSCYKQPREQNDDFFSFLASFDLPVIACSVFVILFFLLVHSSCNSKALLKNLWSFYGFIFNGLDFAPSKLLWRKVMLLTFGLFVVIFQIIALGFVNTSFVIPDKCEKIETVADIINFNVTLLLENNDLCSHYIMSLTTKDGNRIKPGLRWPTSEEITKIHSGQMFLPPNTVYIAHSQAQKRFLVDQYALPKASRFVGQISSSPFYETQTAKPMNKNAPKEVLKKLKRYLSSKFEQGISPEIADTLLRPYMYMLSKPLPSNQAIAVPLSISYFKTGFAAFFLIVTLASLTFFCELFIFNDKVTVK